MKTLKVRIICTAYYDSEILVPDELSLEGARDFAKSHMEDIPVTEMEWIGDIEMDEDEDYLAESETDDEDYLAVDGANHLGPFRK